MSDPVITSIQPIISNGECSDPKKPIKVEVTYDANNQKVTFIGNGDQWDFDNPNNPRSIEAKNAGLTPEYIQRQLKKTTQLFCRFDSYVNSSTEVIAFRNQLIDIESLIPKLSLINLANPIPNQQKDLQSLMTKFYSLPADIQVSFKKTIEQILSKNDPLLNPFCQWTLGFMNAREELLRVFPEPLRNIPEVQKWVFQVVDFIATQNGGNPNLNHLEEINFGLDRILINHKAVDLQEVYLNLSQVLDQQTIQNNGVLLSAQPASRKEEMSRLLQRDHFNQRYEFLLAPNKEQALSRNIETRFLRPLFPQQMSEIIQTTPLDQALANKVDEDGMEWSKREDDERKKSLSGKILTTFNPTVFGKADSVLKPVMEVDRTIPRITFNVEGLEKNFKAQLEMAAPKDPSKKSQFKKELAAGLLLYLQYLFGPELKTRGAKEGVWNALSKDRTEVWVDEKKLKKFAEKLRDEVGIEKSSIFAGSAAGKALGGKPSKLGADDIAIITGGGAVIAGALTFAGVLWGNISKTPKKFVIPLSPGAKGTTGFTHPTNGHLSVAPTIAPGFAGIQFSGKF